MSDLSKLSDADLMAALGQSAPAPAAAAPDVSKLSDADLMAALGQSAPAPAAPAAPRSWLDTLRSLGGEGSDPAVAQAPPPLPPMVQANSMPYAESVGNALGAIGTGADRGVRMLAEGATLGTANKVAAGLNTGFGYLGDYQKELARQRGIDAETEKAAPLASTLLKGAGNAAAMFALQGAGVPVFGAEGSGLAMRTGQAAVANGLLGGAAGFVNEDASAQKATAAGREAVIHGLTGAAGPVGGAVLGGVAGYAGRQLASRFDPDSYAAGLLGNTLRSSGRTLDDVVNTVATANAEGAPYVVADAMGHSGRRALAGVAKTPGPGRELAVEAMEQRQAGQARRLQNAIIEGLDAPQTAAATEAGLTAARNTAANEAYGAARAQAGAVDVSPALMRIDQTLAPGASGVADPGSRLRDDTIEATLRRVRGMLSTDAEQLTGFEAVHRVRQEVQDMIARAGAQTNKGRLLGEVERDLGQAMARTSPPQAAADAEYAAASRRIEAVGTGRNAALRGRTEDTIPAFQALTPEQQAAYRAGYADPYISKIQGAPVGNNVARELTSDAVQHEFPVIAGPDRAPLLMRRIGYENEMFRTRAAATGGSTTAENLADQAAQGGVSREAMADALRGNVPGLALRAVNGIANLATGSTEAGREAMARMLLSRDPVALRAALQAQQQAQARRDLIAQALARGAANYGASTFRASR